MNIDKLVQAGLSHNKVCVLTALDRNKHSFNKPVGYGKVNKDQVAILQHRVNCSTAKDH